ncbi:MAG: ATP-binding protein, partial [Muribaculaceae bacterium]|nr:ATP-binding protein [Muribaculaceae bacterium]
MKFYNSTKEIEELRRIQARAFESRSRMTVITGRRRIGKTSLAMRATQGEYPTVYLFVSRKNEAALCEEFARLISSALNCYVPAEIKSFRSLFQMLMELGKSHRYNLIIDEFQEFFNINPSVYSDMQNIWDTYRNDTHVNLLLMGSVYSMMHKIFENYHEPLFGRADAMIRLSGFGTETFKEIMRDYRPEYTHDELLALYTITGGVPKYIELLCEDTDMSIDGMFDYVVRENSLFVNEGRNILIEEFGKDYGLYFSVLSCIASGINTQGAIESALGGVTVSGHLKRLIEDYSLIKRVRPIMSKPRSQNVQYEINDNFLRFWFNYFDRNQTLVELGNFEYLRQMVLSDYPTFSGLALEKWFRLKMMESHEYSDIGSWWERKKGKDANEIDIVALSVDGKTAVVAEVKRQKRNYDHNQFMEKVERIKTSILSKYKFETRLYT